MRVCLREYIGCVRRIKTTPFLFCARRHVIKRQGQAFSLPFFPCMVTSCFRAQPWISFTSFVKCLNYLNESRGVCGRACVGSVLTCKCGASFFENRIQTTRLPSSPSLRTPNLKGDKAGSQGTYECKMKCLVPLTASRLCALRL